MIFSWPKLAICSKKKSRAGGKTKQHFHGVKLYKILSSASDENLAKECLALWKYAGGASNQAKSFWISRKSRPRNQLENFAKNISEFHCLNDYVG